MLDVTPVVMLYDLRLLISSSLDLETYCGISEVSDHTGEAQRQGTVYGI